MNAIFSLVYAVSSCTGGLPSGTFTVVGSVEPTVRVALVGNWGSEFTTSTIAGPAGTNNRLKKPLLSVVTTVVNPFVSVMETSTPGSGESATSNTPFVFESM